MSQDNDDGVDSSADCPGAPATLDVTRHCDRR